MRHLKHLVLLDSGREPGHASPHDPEETSPSPSPSVSTPGGDSLGVSLPDPYKSLWDDLFASMEETDRRMQALLARMRDGAA
jgi:hypothetical protein